MKRGEAHFVGTHLLDPATGQYNLADVRRHLEGEKVVVVHLVVRDQGLIVPRGNPKQLGSLADLARDEIQFVNRQPGAGTRVLLDYELGQLGIEPAQIKGYEREEYTHMAVAVAVASGLADCGLGVKSAAVALGLDFVPVAREEYDLVFRRDFFESIASRTVLDVIRSDGFRSAVEALGGYDAGRSGTVKELPAPSAARRSVPKPKRKVGRRPS